MYKAKVVKLQVRPHPNADRLQLGYVQGIQVIVGNDVKDGDIGVFFPCDGQLSNEFLSTHNLYRHSELNSDTTKTGYFSDNGRVTAEKIRGERSEGFYCSLSDFKYTGYDLSKLNVGDEFDELNGHKICGKYYTPATLRAMSRNGSGNKKFKRTQADYNLPRHFDTEQLQYNLDKIEAGDLVIISEKCHGCVDKDTIINTEEFGDMRIQEIVDKKLNVSVLSFDVIKNKQVYSKVEGYYFYPQDNDWYEIELDNGVKITITGNNPVWLPQLECYRRVENLIEGDVLAIK